MKSFILAMLVVCALLTACSASPSTLPSDASPSLAISPSDVPSTPIVTAAALPSPTISAVETIDGPSILDPNNMYEIYGDPAQLHYDPERAIPQGETPGMQAVEAEAIALCDEYFQIIAKSITQEEELDLSPLYDLSTDTRRMDWQFNQMYLYSEVVYKGPVLDAAYDGSAYFFYWEEWDAQADDGVLVVFTKTGFTHQHSSGQSIQYGGVDFGSLTDEFAFTRIDGQLKVIRHRSYDFNYLSLQQRLIENSYLLLDDLDAFRRYIDEMPS